MMKSNLPLRIKLFWKRMWDMKLKTKIRITLFVISVSTVLGIGTYSYHIARRELLNNSRNAVLSMEKQGGKNLDDRVSAFQDVSYRIIQAENIVRLLDYSAEEAAKNRTANEGLPAAISQQSSLYQYTRFAFLRPLSGAVYDYYKNEKNKLGEAERDQLLDTLDQLVTRNRPICWVTVDDQVYFVRQIVNSSFQEKGLLCFAIDESFFEFISEDVEYLSNDQAIVLNQEGRTLKGGQDGMGREILKDLQGGEYEDTNAQRTYPDTSSSKTGTPRVKWYTYHYTKNTKEGDYTVAAIRTQRNGWTVVLYFSHTVLLRGIWEIYRGMLRVVTAVAVIVLAVTALLSKSITRNVRLIEEGMRQYEAGCFDYRISPASYDEVGLLGLQLNYMAVKISQLISMVHREEEEKKQKEIETLQAQINPHFLYNTLGSLKWSAFRGGHKELAGALDSLSNLLRFTIKKAGGLVTVDEEIQYIDNYVAIERMRYGDAFSVRYEIEEDIKGLEVPGFILQPLVENCFLHGLDMAKGGGVIVIRGYRDQKQLLIDIEDNGEGIPKERQEELLKPKEEKAKKFKGFNSIGLSIVDRRLRELYGEEYRTIIQSSPGNGTKITLSIPLEVVLNEMESADCG